MEAPSKIIMVKIYIGDAVATRIGRRQGEYSLDVDTSIPGTLEALAGMSENCIAETISLYDTAHDRAVALVATWAVDVQSKRDADEKRRADQIAAATEWLAKSDDKKICMNRDEWNRYFISSDIIHTAPVRDEIARLEKIIVEHNEKIRQERLIQNILLAQGYLNRIADEGVGFALWYSGERDGWKLNFTVLSDPLVRDAMPNVNWENLDKIILDRCNDLTGRGIKMELKKYRQLTTVIESMGTDTQRARWIEGVMPVAEAIELVRHDAFRLLIAVGYKILPSDEYHLSPDADDGDVTESEKRTLTDEQYVTAKKIRDLLPGWDHGYWQQSYQTSDGDTVKSVYIRVSKKIGELDISADIEIPTSAD